MAPGTRVGTVIENKYRLDEQIGHGGMGAVYRGTQLAVDRPVAVKLLHPNYVGHKKLQARFEVEARAIARLNHPNCITLFDFGYSDSIGAFYTIVEYIDGIPLHELIPQNPSVKRVVDVIRQIASALGHAHHHGILHRDLKPENIMLARMTDGTEMVKVLDFGIAQIMKGESGEDEDDDDFEADRLTRVGEVFGTPPYMSPEQARSSRDLTPAADIYSLGIIFYELLEGRLPFLADSPMEILGMHMHDPPPAMVRSGLSEPVKDVVRKMLAKEPEHRPKSGAELLSLLDAIPTGALEENRRGVKVPSAPAERPEEKTLLLPDEKGSPGLGDERNIVTEFDADSQSSAGRSVIPPTAPMLDPRGVARDVDVASTPSGWSSDDQIDDLEIPEDLPPPKTVFLSDGPDELNEVRQGGTNRNLVVLFFLILVGLVVAMFWVFSQDKAEPTGEPSLTNEARVISEDEGGQGLNRLEDDREESEAFDVRESPENVREVRINEPGSEPADEADQVREESSSAPPPTRPATQRRLQEEQNDDETSAPRPTRRPRRPATLDTSGSVQEDDEEQEDDVRRPVRMGL